MEVPVNNFPSYGILGGSTEYVAIFLPSMLSNR